MFDLPAGTVAERRAYTKFRKILITSGFLQMQESVYCKIVPNSAMADAVLVHIRKNKPDEGLVQILKVTEKQFAKMEYIVGNRNSDVLDTDERMVIL